MRVRHERRVVGVGVLLLWLVGVTLASPAAAGGGFTPGAPGAW